MNSTTTEGATTAMPVPDARSRKLAMAARRFLVPRFFVTLYAFCRWRAKVSTRAEIELTATLSLGRGTTISSFSKFKATEGRLITGRDCGFATGCFVAAGAGGIEFGDDVIVGPNVSMIASNYRYERLEVPLEDQGQTSRGIRVGSNVWIGANCVVLDGSVIGDNSIVVANSLVNRRFPPNSIIQGNPARVILDRGRG